MAPATETPPTGPDPAHRMVDLPDHRRLEVRPATAADIRGLAALFAGLGEEEERLRFFSSFRPSRTFLKRMVEVDQRGGCQLVAVADPGLPAARVVGEAGYNLLDNGNGELAVTVAADWRGWLGPFLLEVLIRTASARGVPNLEAVVLVDNRTMMRMLRSRGAVYLDHPDWTVTRLLLGTTERTPSWPRSPGPRVLVESPWSRWHGEEKLRRAGAQVVICPGPEAGPQRCPALAGRECPLVAGADLVVVADPEHGDWPAVLEAHRRHHPDVAVCVEQHPARTLPADPDPAQTTEP